MASQSSPSDWFDKGLVRRMHPEHKTAKVHVGENDECGRWPAFTQEVSMHGIRYLYSPKLPLGVKLLWLLTTIGAIVYAVAACNQFFTTYSRRETNTKFKNIRVRELQFPSIVLCERNSFSKDSLQRIILERNLTGLDILLKDLFSYELAPLTPVNWSLPEYRPLFDLSSQQMEDLLLDIAPKMETIIFFAAYNRKRLVNISEEFQRVVTDMGLCYVFNSDGKHKLLVPGMFSGLVIHLNTYVDNYYIGPGAMASGFTVALYRPGEIPVVSTDGNIGIKPGSYVNLVLEENRIKRQPPPADNQTADCYDTETKPNYLSYYPQYTYNACYRECSTNFSMKKCGCRNIFDPDVGGAEICKPDKLLSCILPLNNDNVGERVAYFEDVCKCKNTCTEQHYSAQMAVYDFPNSRYMIDLHNISPETIAYAKENMAYLTINFRSLTYNLLEEYLAYTWMDAIANLGGTLGVCIGASLLTICEFIQFGVSSLARSWSRVMKKRRTGSVIQVAPAPSAAPGTTVGI